VHRLTSFLFVVALATSLLPITATIAKAAPAPPNCASGGTCSVGDTGPGGGKVFYVAPGGGTFACGQSLASTCKYLEAAMSSSSPSWTDDRYAWSGNTNTAIGTTSTAIGAGYSNTLKMVRQIGAGNAGAGSAARNYRGGGLNDWYLPSKDELNQITANQTLLDATAGYWSSSENNSTTAWDQGSNSVQGAGTKTSTTPVRPIRAFGSSSPEDAIIYVPSIGGVTAPVTGATPVNSVTAANGYTGTVSWSGSPSTFAALTIYTATITLTATSGFTLTGVTADFFAVTGATSVTNSADSGVITVVFPATGVGAASAAAITTQPVGGASGSLLGTQPVIRIVDSGGNTVSSSSVNVVASIASGTGTLSGTTTVAASSGIATFTNLVITGTAGNFTLIFTPTSLTAATSNSISITVGAATKVAITLASVGTQRRTAFTTQPQISIQDASNNTITSSSALVTATISAGATLLGTTTATATSGVATFMNLGIDSGTVGTNYTITYAVTGLTPATATITLSGTTCDGTSFTCQVGDTGPGGGKVFYVAPGTFTQIGATGSMCSTGCKYLEAAPTSGTSSWAATATEWSGETSTAIGVTAQRTAIGSGYANTLAMIAQANSSGKAGAVSQNYRGPNNKTDWYLPSQDELTALYSETSVVGGFAPANEFWSSTEVDASQAWYRFFSGGGDGPDPKDMLYHVRPIRAFGTPTTPTPDPVITTSIPTYRVTYFGNGADDGTFPTTSATRGTNLTIITQEPTRSGFKFEGWNTSSDGTGTKYVAGNTITIGNSNIELFASWLKLYSLSYTPNGGTANPIPPSASSVSGTALIISGQIPMRTGYTFVSWNSTANGLGTKYLPGDTLTVTTSDVTLHAQWQINSYRLDFDSNGDSLLKIDSMTMNYASSMTIPDFPLGYSRAGYTFLGWNTSIAGTGKSYAIGDSFTFSASNAMLFAQWKINQYTINYDANGNRVGRVPSSVTQDFNTNIAIAAPSQVFTKIGYTFQGWNTSRDGSGKTYRVGESLLVGSANQTLYAYWVPNAYKVTYISTANVYLDSGSFVTGGSILKPPSPPARDGYKFQGWSNSPSRNKLLSFPYSPGVTRNISLYAVWTKTK
jgi:uncharacterized repeat protein (TIGR02543 family)